MPSGAVDSPAISFQTAVFDVRPLRITCLRFERPHPVVRILAIVSGVINVPLAVKQVEFGRPDILAIHPVAGRSPDAHTVVLRQIQKRNIRE